MLLPQNMPPTGFPKFAQGKPRIREGGWVNKQSKVMVRRCDTKYELLGPQSGK